MGSKYDSLIQRMPLLFLVADTEGRIIKINEYWEKVLGYTEDDLIGKKFMDLIHPEDKERTIKEMKSMHDQDRPCEKLVNRYKCKKITKENQNLLLEEGYINLEWYSSNWYHDKVCAMALFRF